MDSIFERPIFLFGCHKSGTSLLRSLLDDHPELLCVPKETHFFQASGFPVDYPLRKEIGVRPSHMFSADQYKEFLLKENSETSEFSDNSNFIFDVHAFENSFNSISKNASLRYHYEAYMKGIMAASGVELHQESKYRIVEKTVENFEYYSLLNGMFPRAKFIHIIRDPYATLYAIRKMKTYADYPLITGIVRAIRQSLACAYKSSFLEDQYLVVKYEDLVSDPKRVMLQISKFVRIEFLDILLEPTIGGRPWSGNSISGEKFSGISENSLFRWKGKINQLELWVINRYLKFYISQFGYQHIAAKYPVLPMNGERFVNYYRNRISFLAHDI